jgi:bacillolysin
MKTHDSFLRLCLISIILLPVLVHAQDTFHSKKKKSSIVNTSSLKAGRIKGSSSNGNPRLMPSSTRYTTATNRAFIKPLQQYPSQKVSYNNETGLPSFITSRREHSMARQGIQKDLKTACYDYLRELKPLLQLEKPDADFLVSNIQIDQVNKKHVRLQQVYKGVPVYGGEVIVHLNEFGEGEAFNGNYFLITKNITNVPQVSEQLAIEKVSTHLTNGKVARSFTSLEKKLVQFETPKATLCIYQDKGLVKTFTLAYHVIACPTLHKRWEYFIDAITGAVLHRFESNCSVDGPRSAIATDLNGVSRSVRTYQKGTTYFMLDTSRPMFNATGSVLPDEPIGGILTVDMNNTFGATQAIQQSTSTNNVWNTANQSKVITAHFNAGEAYEYFRTKHNRNSINGNNGTIISIVNVPDETGKPLDNAFWNGKAMFYGNGDRGFKPLAGSMDVAGHEMTHGVIQNTANLEYQGESGAINESMADIFGSMMDPTDWLIGEDIVKTSVYPSGALRSMSDPHNGGTSLADNGYQPKHTNEAYKGSEDNGGVHINSGIPNHAFYKYAIAITPDKAAVVFYKALNDYLTKSSQFIDLRLAVVKAAGDLYGASSNEVTQAGIAFDAVGIGAGQAGNYTETLPGNPGTEFLLVNNTDATDATTLYRTTLDGVTFTPLSTTIFNSRPSITDNGEIGVFVAADKTIHGIRTAPGNQPEEFVLQSEQIWSNVVISKGGTKIAAVTIAEEPVIYVYDFASEVWSEFTLYNPTYTEGVTSAGPVYADALEWDYAGEFLVYDCFNRIDNSSGADIEYWDVNFIKVWSNTTNSFGDGTISKLFTSLPDGISIGNPSFTKNSPSIIAFDYFDSNTSEYAVLGCNVETNEVNVITLNNTLGWPSFNKNDSRIAFTSLDSNGKFNASYVTLNSDKISSSASIVDLYTDAKWPLYFSTGERDIEDKVITDVTEGVNDAVTLYCYPNPFSRTISLNIGVPYALKNSIEVINQMGQKVYEYTALHGHEEPTQLNLEDLPSGFYLIRTSSTKESGFCRVVKE